MPTWMTTLWNAGIGFNGRSLNQITLPGTHDAGCYPNNWGAFFARTQTHTIQQQLAGGIRYFDIRPYRSVTGGDSTFWTYHGNYWGDQIDGPLGILSQLNNFMNGLGGGDRELVILNISHFSNFNDDAHRLLICKIYRALENHLLPNTQAAINLFNATYANLLTDAAGTTRSRVAIIYDGALDQGREHYLTVPANLADLPPGFFVLSPKYNVPLANRIFLFDQYANKCWLADGYLTTGMCTDQLAKLRNRQNRPQEYSNPAANWPANAVGGVASTLHLFSWTLTPQLCGGSPLTEAQNQSNPALLPLFSAATGGWAGAAGNYDPAADFKINILYVDDYNSNQYNNLAGSPCNGWAMPVAIAYRLNVGPPWPANW